jgi:hypothetical protein
MKVPMLNTWLLPKTSDDRGMGYLMNEADRVVTRRELDGASGFKQARAGFLQL